MKTCDIIIIGSGQGGSALAQHLATPVFIHPTFNEGVRSLARRFADHA